MARTGIKQDVSYYVNLRGQWQNQFKQLIDSTGKADSAMKRIGETAAGFALGAHFDRIAQGAVKAAIEIGKMGLKSEGVKRAFDKNFTKQQFRGLQDATAGTVNQLELMQQAIKAKNFKIPIDTLTKGLAFARKRAQDTGLATNYLVDSFVWGLGTQSTRVMDNLGISLKELNAEIEKLGGNRSKNFTQAISNILDREPGKAILLVSERITQMKVKIQDTAIAMGNRLLPTMNRFIDLVYRAANALKEFVERNKDTLDVLIRLGAILAGVGAALYAIALLTSPILLVALAIGAVVWGLASIISESESATESLRTFWDGAKSVFTNMRGLIQGLIDSYLALNAAARVALDPTLSAAERVVEFAIMKTYADSAAKKFAEFGKDVNFDIEKNRANRRVNRAKGGKDKNNIIDQIKEFVKPLTPGGDPGDFKAIMPEGFGDESTGGSISGVASRAPATFHINIDRQIENFNVNTGSFTEGADNIREKMSAILLDVINDIQRVSKNAR